MLGKLIIFLISFISVISSAISIGILNITSLNICVIAGILLLLSMKSNENPHFLSVVYLGCCVELGLFVIDTTLRTGIDNKEFWIDFFGIMVLFFLGYFIIKKTQNAKTMLFMITLILNSTICYHGFKFEYLVLQCCTLLLVIVSNGRNKHKFTLIEKIILSLGIICLCIYNLIFIIPGIVFILSEKYPCINKENSIYNLRYIFYLCILAYLLFVQEGYMPQNLWNIMWSSFENIFNLYDIYTALIFAYALLNIKSRIKLSNHEMLSILLLISIFILLFDKQLLENDILITGGILIGIFIGIPKISLNNHEWTDYMLISYSIALTGIYMLNLNIV